jgi:hypothetical protein
MSLLQAAARRALGALGPAGAAPAGARAAATALLHGSCRTPAPAAPARGGEPKSGGQPKDSGGATTGHGGGENPAKQGTADEVASATAASDQPHPAGASKPGEELYGRPDRDPLPSPAAALTQGAASEAGGLRRGGARLDLAVFAPTLVAVLARLCSLFLAGRETQAPPPCDVRLFRIRHVARARAGAGARRLPPPQRPQRGGGRAGAVGGAYGGPAAPGEARRGVSVLGSLWRAASCVASAPRLLARARTGPSAACFSCPPAGRGSPPRTSA